MNPKLSALRRKLAEQNLDAILITQPENRLYLSSFTGSAGALLISQDQAIIATDFRYFEQVAKQAPKFQLAKVKQDEFAKALPDLVAQLRAKRVGFESAGLTFAQYREWGDVSTDFELVPTRDVVEDLRAVKGEDEIAAIKRAVAISDAAFAYILDFIELGMTEKEVAWELESYMRTHGADKAAFDLIVAAGPNGAMPHAVTSGRVIEEGEPIIIDIGAQVDGYRSDLTRTICLGQPDDKFKEIYGLVLGAQLAAEEAIRPGMAGKEADAIARRLIEEAGYGEQFGHGLGHGVGLAVHEKPTLRKPSEDVLKPGMVFTVEPGIYIPDWGGVRIEDMVVLRGSGVEVLSQATKEVIR